jgi:hypothetical protein
MPDAGARKMTLLGLGVCLVMFVPILYVHYRNVRWNLRYRRSMGMATSVSEMFRMLLGRQRSRWLIGVIIVVLAGLTAYVLGMNVAARSGDPMVGALGSMSLLAGAGSYALWILCPPSLILLGPSSLQVSTLHHRIAHAIQPLKVVAFLRSKVYSDDVVEKLKDGNTERLRSNDDKNWLLDVAHAIRNIPIVVVDCRQITDHVLAEIAFLDELTTDGHSIYLLAAGEAPRPASPNGGTEVRVVRDEESLLAKLINLQAIDAGSARDGHRTPDG